jgi:hypothetical protein
VYCAQLTNLLFISHLVFVTFQNLLLFATLPFFKVIRERACWRQVGGPRKNGDFNSFLLAWRRDNGADLSKLRERKRESCCLLFIMPPLLSVPEWDGDNITPKFDIFVLNKNDVATATSHQDPVREEVI